MRSSFGVVGAFDALADFVGVGFPLVCPLGLASVGWSVDVVSAERLSAIRAMTKMTRSTAAAAANHGSHGGNRLRPPAGAVEGRRGGPGSAPAGEVPVSTR